MLQRVTTARLRQFEIGLHATHLKQKYRASLIIVTINTTTIIIIMIINVIIHCHEHTDLHV